MKRPAILPEGIRPAKEWTSVEGIILMEGREVSVRLPNGTLATGVARKVGDQWQVHLPYGVVYDRPDMERWLDLASVMGLDSSAPANEIHAEASRRLQKQTPEDVHEVDPRLVHALAILGDEFGLMGVALAAAGMTDTRGLLLRLLTGGLPEAREATPGAAIEPAAPARLAFQPEMEQECAGWTGATWMMGRYQGSSSKYRPVLFDADAKMFAPVDPESLRDATGWHLPVPGEKVQGWDLETERWLVGTFVRWHDAETSLIRGTEITYSSQGMEGFIGEHGIHRTDLYVWRADLGDRPEAVQLVPVDPAGGPPVRDGAVPDMG